MSSSVLCCDAGRMFAAMCLGQFGIMARDGTPAGAALHFVPVEETLTAETLRTLWAPHTPAEAVAAAAATVAGSGDAKRPAPQQHSGMEL